MLSFATLHRSRWEIYCSQLASEEIGASSFKMADSGGPGDESRTSDVAAHLFSFHLEAQDRAFRRPVQLVLLWGLREMTRQMTLLLLLQSLHSGGVVGKILSGPSGGSSSVEAAR